MTDRKIVLAIIGALALVALILASSLAYAVVSGASVAEAVLTLLSAQLGAAVGALGTMLAHTGTTPQPVNVVNEPTDPVPVDTSADDAEAGYTLVEVGLFLLLLAIALAVIVRLT